MTTLKAMFSYFLILVSTLSFGQTALNLFEVKILKENGSYKYSQIFSVEKRASHIYEKANVWIAENYASANDVIQLNTPKKIICKGNFALNNFKGGIAKHMLTIDIKENKYRLSVTNLIYYDSGAGNVAFEKMMFQKSIIKKAEKELSQIVKSLYEDIDNEETDDW